MSPSIRRGRLGATMAAALVLLAVSLVACQPSDPSKCPSRGSGQVRVAVVVDARSLGASTSVVCVVVPSGSTGATALRARADRLGTPRPRYNSDGLLCAIDGRPTAPACGNAGPNGYEYWSYWLGGSSWHYATVGPAGRRVADQSVDGWRFIPGGDNVAPNRSPSFSTLTS